MSHFKDFKEDTQNRNIKSLQDHERYEDKKHKVDEAAQDAKIASWTGSSSVESEAKQDASLLSVSERLAKLEAGSAGTKGEKGDAGKDGADGVQGFVGQAGVDGKNGVDGVNGVDGKAGVDGQTGIQGDKGAQGKDGVQGLDGVPGDKGNKGDVGVAGATFDATDILARLDKIEAEHANLPVPVTLSQVNEAIAQDKRNAQVNTPDKPI